MAIDHVVFNVRDPEASVAWWRDALGLHPVRLVADVDLDEVAGSGRFDVARGPVDVFGARGQGRGPYVRDPDGNVVELRTCPAG